jgi:DNA invertase Pin-like site-specific DNA recombinase
MVWRLDRLGCTMHHLIQIVNDLNNGKFETPYADVTARIDATTTRNVHPKTD